MATIQHSALTTSDLHEPKGTSTATAGQIYVADGAGSGTWSYLPTGWAAYDDNTAEQTFNGTAAKLTIDGLGSASEESYLPLSIRGTQSLWDTSTNMITPIAVGDSYTLRVNLPVTSRASANYAEVEFDIGGAATPTIVIATQRVETSKAAPFGVSFTIGLYSLSTFLANGCQIFIKTDSGSIGVTAPSVFIAREHGEIV